MTVRGMQWGPHSYLQRSSANPHSQQQTLVFKRETLSRGDMIRTCDLLLPKQAHYQAVLRPEGA